MNLSQDLKTELLPKLRARYARRHRDGKSRLLAPARAQQPLRGRCGTKPGTLLRTEIPIRTAWDVSRPVIWKRTAWHCGAAWPGISSGA